MLNATKKKQPVYNITDYKMNLQKMIKRQKINAKRVEKEKERKCKTADGTQFLCEFQQIVNCTGICLPMLMCSESILDV